MILYLSASFWCWKVSFLFSLFAKSSALLLLATHLSRLISLNISFPSCCQPFFFKTTTSVGKAFLSSCSPDGTCCGNGRHDLISFQGFLLFFCTRCFVDVLTLHNGGVRLVILIKNKTMIILPHWTQEEKIPSAQHRITAY